MLSLSKTHLFVPDFIAQPVKGLLDAYRAFQRCEMPCEVTPMQVHRAAVFASHACLLITASHACLLITASHACLVCNASHACLVSNASMLVFYPMHHMLVSMLNDGSCKAGDLNWQCAVELDPAILLFER